MHARRSFLFAATVSAVVLLAASGQAQNSLRRTSLAVLDFGESNTGRLASAQFWWSLAVAPDLSLVDRDLSRVAARGTGYSGSLNLTLPEARDLGAAIGCDFYLIGDAQTVRRSPSTGPPYFESYASLFLVSARTGRLLSWDRPAFQAANAAAAEKLLLAELSGDDRRARYLLQISHASEDERHERQIAVERNTPVIEEAPGDDHAEANGLQLPRPYRRLRPSYPDTAARADAEGTVDVLVDLDKEGEVTHVELERWAGFGLDQASLETARQLHFFPAMRDGVPLPLRVLLRYNFRRPATETKK